LLAHLSSPPGFVKDFSLKLLNRQRIIAAHARKAALIIKTVIDLQREGWTAERAVAEMKKFDFDRGMAVDTGQK
jgi:hypothetical protein